MQHESNVYLTFQKKRGAPSTPLLNLPMLMKKSMAKRTFNGGGSQHMQSASYMYYRLFLQGQPLVKLKSIQCWSVVYPMCKEEIQRWWHVLQRKPSSVLLCLLVWLPLTLSHIGEQIVLTLFLHSVVWAPGVGLCLGCHGDPLVADRISVLLFCYLLGT